MSKPKAVLISDIHFNLQNLPLALAALKHALAEAQKLCVPLIIAGDLNDTKAIIRAEVANALISILETATIEVIILVGNHDLVNEKGKEHSLNFLAPYSTIIQTPSQYQGLWLLPYHHDADPLKQVLEGIPNGTTLVMHQGVCGAFMGDYVVDKSSIDPSFLARFKVFSGHYHRHQTLYTDYKTHAEPCGIGTFTYIGSPYTTSFTEANDPAKGFLVLYEDGSFERHLTGLRRHVVIEKDFDNFTQIPKVGANDKIWLKILGPFSELDKLKKHDIGMKLFGHSNYKLDKIYTDSEDTSIETPVLTDAQIFDNIIDETTESAAQKENLKQLWREVANEYSRGN